MALLFASHTTIAQNKPILNHIALYVTDLKTSTQSYQQVIGLEEWTFDVEGLYEVAFAERLLDPRR